MEDRVLLGETDIRRALRRVAHQIAEQNKGVAELSLVGLHTRGVPLAHRIAQALEEFEGVAVPVGTLDVSLYRDDLHISRPLLPLGKTEIPIAIDISNRVVVLVDDVLFTGRTVRAAMDALMDFGRPRAIQLTVLVDRGHRELPIRADYVGMNIPTAAHERIRVRLREVDGRDEVALVRGK